MSKPDVTYERLIAYAAGELPAGKAAEVEGHLPTHRAAAASVALYRAVGECVRRDDSVSPPATAVARARAIFRRKPVPAGSSWLDRVTATAARLIYDSRVQPAGVRHADASRRIQLAYEADDLDVDLAAEPSAAAGRSGGWRMIGQINPATGSGGIAVAVVRTGTRSAVAETRADERALFTLEVPPGTYDLFLKLPRGVVVLPDLDLE